MKKLICLLVVIGISGLLYAHPGRTDSKGGHRDRKTGEYHSHDSESAGSSSKASVPRGKAAATGKDGAQISVKKLQGKVELQNRLIKRMKRELAEQKRKIERLTALCKEAGIDVTLALSAKAEDGNNFIMYQGKGRSKKWFERMYERFADKLEVVDAGSDANNVGQYKYKKEMSENPAKIDRKQFKEAINQGLKLGEHRVENSESKIVPIK